MTYPWHVRREDCIANHSDLRSRLDALLTPPEVDASTQGWRGRFGRALLSPLRRAILGPVVDRQRRAIEILFEYETALASASARVELAQSTAQSAAEAIDVMRGDSARTMEHLAALQEDHSGLRAETSALQSEVSELTRTVADLQRDMTTLAEALSLLENG